MSGFFGAIGSGLLHLVLPALGTIVTGLLVNLIQKKAQQAGVELTQAQTDLLKTEVTHAVQAVEEMAMRAKAAGTPMSKEEKRAAALAIVASRPVVVQGNIQQMIDAVLPEVRKKLAQPAGLTLPPVV